MHAHSYWPPRRSPGDRVRTADDGRGTFDIGFGVVNVGGSSEAVFNSTGASMSVLRGKTGVRIDESVPKKEFRVETPQASMGVRGTMFLVDVEDDATTVTVAEGKVKLGARMLEAGDAVRVVAGAEAEDADDPDDAEPRFERLTGSFTFPRLEWVLVPAGKFEMGLAQPAAPLGANALEHSPIQTLQMPAFLMTRTELTVGEFRAFRSWALTVGVENVVRTLVPPRRRTMDDEIVVRETPPMIDEEPITLPWYDARAVAAGYGARLQSDAEWEYACYAGARTTHWWGDNGREYRDYEWLGGNSGERPIDGGSVSRAAPVLSPERIKQLGVRPRAVGTLRPNKWGLHDMLGNVVEWCEDTPHMRLRGQPTDGSPRTNGDPAIRTMRGCGVRQLIPQHGIYRSSRPIHALTIGVRMVRRIAQE